MLRKRKGSRYWHYDFTVKGNRFRGSTETEARADAEIIEAKLKSDEILGIHTGRKPRATLEQACARYWLEHASFLPSGERSIKYQLRTLQKHLGKNVMLDQMTNARVAEYVAKRRGMVSDLAVNTELKYLRAVMLRAADVGGFDVATINWKKLRLKEPDLEDRYLEPEQVDRLIHEAAPHLKPIIRFSVYTGVRAANAIQLDWSQINMRRREITFKVKSSQHQGGKKHVIQMSEDVFVLLANMGPKDEGPVFNYKGRAIKSVKTAFNSARKRAGITGARWHDLRHTFGSWLAQEGVELDIIQDLMGHASIETTRRYARRKEEQKREAVGAIASRWRHSQDAEIPETVENGGKTAGRA